MRMFLVAMAAPLLMLALTATACGGGGGGQAETSTPTSPEVRSIEVHTTDDLTFDPSELNAAPGETVAFNLVNESNFEHTFTIAKSQQKAEILKDISLAGNETTTVEVTFPDSGEALYLFCRPHEAQGMTGTVHVGEGGAGTDGGDDSPDGGLY